jgi:hypothetical protein
MFGSWRRQTRFAAACAVAALPSRGLAAHVAVRLEKAESLEASALVQTLAAIGEDVPDEALAAMRSAAGLAGLAPEIAEELQDAIRTLEARDG